MALINRRESRGNTASDNTGLNSVRFNMCP
jgi:hypothetical protein